MTECQNCGNEISNEDVEILCDTCWLEIPEHQNLCCDCYHDIYETKQKFPIAEALWAVLVLAIFALLAIIH